MAHPHRLHRHRTTRVLTKAEGESQLVSTAADCRMLHGETGSQPSGATAPDDAVAAGRAGGTARAVMTGMLTLDETLRLTSAARSAATEIGVPMSFAVMDPGGHLLALERMDGALWVTADVAQGKAWTSAAYGVPSAAQKDKMLPMPNFAQAITEMTHGRFTPQTGAVPVYRDGVLLGAIGGSGGTGDQDEAACAQAVQQTGFSTTA